jgi:hypothetical protein
MKESMLHDRGIVPILANLDKLFVVKVVFSSGSHNSYYICRNIPVIRNNINKKVWTFIERSLKSRDGEQLLEANSIQEACQAIMDIHSRHYTLSLWEFDCEEEFKEAVQSGVF